MCGIAGYICKDNAVIESGAKIKSMTDAVKHRGPDAEGHWIRNNIALGHRRLSIIDVDKRSSQPMCSYDGKYVITYNGEIYNYIEIREELEKSGSRFKTESDTEVIIEAYRRYGGACIEKFNGMWAFVLYDIDKNQIICSRDRFGIKPLYMLDNEKVFAFASEIKSITAAFPEENIPNDVALYRYLSGSVNENQDEESYYKNIKIFPAAYYMIYDLETNVKTYESYWEVNEQEFYRKWIEGKNAVKTFRKLFESAVMLRMRADVEVGACLSGGLDSSAIVGCAVKKSGKKMHTFSSVYKDEKCNEEAYARAVNQKWNTIAHYVMPDEEEKHFTACIDKIIYHHDGPAKGASLYSQYMVMEEVGKYVKVVLDGQGADELFAGYIPYYSYYISDLMNKGGFLNRMKAVKILTIANEEWSDIVDMVGTDTIVKLVGIHNSFLFRNKKNSRGDQIRRSAVLFTDAFQNKVCDRFSGKEIKCSSELNTRLCNDVLFRSIPSLLHNEDSNSMAFSVESRVPFLDYRIVEFAIALDGRYKIKNQWTKWIIRKSCGKYLPQKVAKRKNKMGFPAPFDRWLREGKSKDEIREIIYAFGDRKIVPEATIDLFYNSHMSGDADLSNILFKFYSAELWLRTCNAV